MPDFTPTQLHKAIQATNTALQLQMCALDLKGIDKSAAMLDAKKALFCSAALLSREIEGVE